MNFTKIEQLIQRRLDKIWKEYTILPSILRAIDHAGGRALLVGGAVRDIVLDVESKDLDIEIYNLTPDQLVGILKNFGAINLVGKSFGVVRLYGLDIDWSVPRADSAGRKPTVTYDPNMSLYEAFKRRDLTINAMGIDLITGEFIDPFRGYKDLLAKTLRAIDESLFVQDPLRLFRVVQFIGRFEMTPDVSLDVICKKMDIHDVSRERIEIEFEKLLLKSRRPSLGLRWLNDISRIAEVLPELSATCGIEQEKIWHPEGDVFEHTMQTLDAAAAFAYDTEYHKLIVLYAAMCHDLGKVTTAKKIKGRLRSFGHAHEGARISGQLLKRITGKLKLIKIVSKLVRYHMCPVQFVRSNVSDAIYKQLAYKLAPDATLFMLGQLAIADKRGRNSFDSMPLIGDNGDVGKFIKKADSLGILYKKEEPLLSGRDFIDVIKQGPEIGILVKQAYTIQIQESIKDKDNLKDIVLKNKNF
jgi:tRNA nucleotidyltransferase (CCA-adding enzyme)